MTYIPGGSEPRREPLGQPAYTPPIMTTQPVQYPPRYAPVLPPKKGRAGLIVGLIVAALVVLGGASAIAAAFTSGGKPATSTAVVAATGVPVKCADGVFSNTGLPNYCAGHGGVAQPTAPAVAVKPDAKGFTIGVKVLRKACFGSAGCNITFRIDPSYNGTPFTDTTTWEIVYQVNGGEDPLVNRFKLTGSRASFDEEETIQTKSSSAVLSAVVVEINEA